MPASAQSDILLRLRSGSPLGDRFRVDSAGGVVAIGVLGIGIIPATGAGERMMWHPWRASFRAGSIGAGGTQWDDANTGFYSWAGGYNTMASQLASFAFGYQSSAQGSYATALGYTANADGTGAVAIGYRPTADADYSVAIGQRASTNGHAGAFVIADGSTTDSVEASANNQFSARMAGGYRLFTNATETTGMSMNAGGSSWNIISDVTRKEHFLAIDGEDVLARIRALPVSSWRYIDEVDRGVRHVGPMAQDWERAFGLSGDPTTINMSDFDGVNLAAIQALEQRTAALREQVAERDRRIESLEERIARLEALVAAQARPRP
ncbi:MAG TPA: tail fiber domain-containing protein, partial [Longimicrobium sp.]|nr:tail fiber domain-containing protein [Longimicrobium sp.]